MGLIPLLFDFWYHVVVLGLARRSDWIMFDTVSEAKIITPQAQKICLQYRIFKIKLRTITNSSFILTFGHTNNVCINAAKVTPLSRETGYLRDL